MWLYVLRGRTSASFRKYVGIRLHRVYIYIHIRIYIYIYIYIHIYIHIQNHPWYVYIIYIYIHMSYNIYIIYISYIYISEIYTSYTSFTSYTSYVSSISYIHLIYALISYTPSMRFTNPPHLSPKAPCWGSHSAPRAKQMRKSAKARKKCPGTWSKCIHPFGF